MNKKELLAGLMFGGGGGSSGGGMATIYDGSVTITDSPALVNISSDIDPAAWTLTFDGHKIEYNGDFYYEDRGTRIGYYLGYDGDDWHAEVFNLDNYEYVPGTYALNILAPSSIIEITSNGVADVSEYAAALVNVPASAVVSGTKQITENGSNIDVTDYAAVDVNVQGDLITRNINVQFTSQSYGEVRIGYVVENGQILPQGKKLSNSGLYALKVLAMNAPRGSDTEYSLVIFPANPASDYVTFTPGSDAQRYSGGEQGIIVKFPSQPPTPTIMITARTT